MVASAPFPACGMKRPWGSLQGELLLCFISVPLKWDELNN